LTKKIWFVSVFTLIGLCLFFLIQIAISAINIKSFTQDNNSANAKQHMLHFIIISQELDNPFWRLVEQGAVEATKQYSAKIDYVGPQRNNTAEQIRLLEKAIASSPDGIILQGIVNDEYTALINIAAEQNIPIITVDADVPNSKRIAYIGTDQLDAGKQLGEHLLQFATNNTKIGVIIGSVEGENQKIRLKGLQQVLSKDTTIDIVAVRSSNISRIKAAEETVQLIKQYPEINTFVGLSSLDGAGIVDGLSHLDNLSEQTQHYSVFAFDKLPITLELVLKGSINATLAQQPEIMGERAVHTMMSYINGEPITSVQFIPSMLIDKGDLEEN